MEVTGTVEGKDQEFTVEIDSYDLFKEIEDSVEECASEAVSNYMEYYEHDVDYASAAADLLREYNPGTGCSLARQFEEAVQGAVLVNGWLAEQVGSPDRDQVKLENTAQLSERNETAAREALVITGDHERRITALEDNPEGVGPLVEREVRKLVRSEVRMALATALGTLTNGEEL